MWAAYVFAGRPTLVEPELFKGVAVIDRSIIASSLVAILLLFSQVPGEVPVWGAADPTHCGSDGASVRQYP
jgi:hypothetical protein